ncbi:hypothetical protein AKO1_013066 [Acrasis kona]|uniref:TLC domain-containing protein n=1 Tax=Acrasis kona TaxID=1008807 RepID=A0AAW2YZW7_9EUKA
MFEVALTSFVLCFTAYLVLLKSLPSIIQFFSSDPKKAIKYFREEITPHEQQHHAQVAISFLHAVVATLGACHSIYAYRLSDYRYVSELIIMDEPRGAYLSELRNFYLEITLGYFFADLLVYCLDVGRYPIIDIAHHVVSIIAYVLGISTNAGTFVMILFQTNECSTPFLHVRYFALQWNKKNNIIYKIAEALFVFLFVASRIVFNFYVMFCLWYGVVTVSAKHHVITEVFLVVCGNLYYLVQCAWFYKIIMMVLRRFDKKRNVTVPTVEELKKEGVKNAESKDQKTK